MEKSNELKAARAFLTEHIPDGAGLLCAVSGGLDSMCLLELARSWGKERGICVTAAHFNHLLRGENAHRDQRFVEGYCREQGIPLLVDQGDTRAFAREEGLSVETAARALRYAFLERGTAEAGCGCILTAHHADDNAETMLLNLCRGTGSAGLGIPAVRGNVYRPFLQITKEDLTTYAMRHKLPYVEDETNAADDAARNLLRHRVLPVLKEINPRAVENMARAARILAQESAALDGMALATLNDGRYGNGWAAFPLETLRRQPAALQGRMALEMMARIGGHRRDLSVAHAEAALALRRGQESSLPYGLLARNTGEDLVIESAPRAPAPLPIALGETVEFGDWRVTLTDDAAPPEGRLAYRFFAPSPEGLQVTAAAPSDRMTVVGSRGSRGLKRLWGDAGIPPSQRSCLPVLRLGNALVAAPYLGVEAAFAPKTEDHKTALQAVFNQFTKGEKL